MGLLITLSSCFEPSCLTSSLNPISRPIIPSFPHLFRWLHPSLLSACGWSFLFQSQNVYEHSMLAICPQNFSVHIGSYMHIATHSHQHFLNTWTLKLRWWAFSCFHVHTWFAHRGGSSEQPCCSYSVNGYGRHTSCKGKNVHCYRILIKWLL